MVSLNDNYQGLFTQLAVWRISSTALKSDTLFRCTCAPFIVNGAPTWFGAAQF